MSASEVYHQVKHLLREQLGEWMEESSFERLCLLVTGMIGAKSASPAQIAKALDRLGLSEAKAESIERRVRRIENDLEIQAALCFHPFAQAHLRYGHPQELLLILDPTTQEDRVVMVTLAVWYRGRALPLGWVVWEGNVPLEGERYWQRIDRLLEEVEPLLPPRVAITLLADRAFGCPAFIDLVEKRHWHYVLRVQGQTRYRDRNGREGNVASLVPYRNRRAKLRAQVFKKNGWREASLVCFWGQRHKHPLCLVSDLKPAWVLIHLYRCRFPIEATFRDYKRYGWQWEQGQVKELGHLQRLLVGMALATWITLLVGTWAAQHYLAKVPTGRRRTTPWEGKMSLFAHGLHWLHTWLGATPLPLFDWRLGDWMAPNWKQQITAHHARAFVFA